MGDHLIAFLFERIRAIKTIRSTFWYSEQPPPPLIFLFFFFFLSLPRFFSQTITFHDVTVVKIAMNLQPGQLFQIKKYILWQWLNFIAPQLPREKDNKLFKMRPREDNELYPPLMRLNETLKLCHHRMHKNIDWHWNLEARSSQKFPICCLQIIQM